ncbi:hypothetical protein ACJEDT_25520 (plasmid) [Rhodococcoides fascians]
MTDTAFSGIVPVIGKQSIDIESAGPDLGEHTTEVLASLELFAKHALSQ